MTLRVRVTARDTAFNSGVTRATRTQWWTAGASSRAPAPQRHADTPNGTQAEGTSRTFTISPSTNYKVADVLVDNVSVGTPASYDLQRDQREPHTLAASFAPITWTITTSAGALPVRSRRQVAEREPGIVARSSRSRRRRAHVNDVSSTACPWARSRATRSATSSRAHDRGELRGRPALLTVTHTGTGINHPIADLAQYAYGTAVTVTAIARAGLGGDGWTGDTTMTGNPLADGRRSARSPRTSWTSPRRAWTCCCRPAVRPGTWARPRPSSGSRRTTPAWTRWTSTSRRVGHGGSPRYGIAHGLANAPARTRGTVQPPATQNGPCARHRARRGGQRLERHAQTAVTVARSEHRRRRGWRRSTFAARASEAESFGRRGAAHVLAAAVGTARVEVLGRERPPHPSDVRRVLRRPPLVALGRTVADGTRARRGSTSRD